MYNIEALRIILLATISNFELPNKMRLHRDVEFLPFMSKVGVSQR